MAPGMALLGSLAAAMPARALDLAIPQNAPSLLSFEAAAIGTNNQAYATYFNLTPFEDQTGTPMSILTSTGVGASVYLDPVGNVIVAFAWAVTAAQDNLSNEILAGYGPDVLPGYADAVTFLRSVQQVATAEGIAPSQIYLTGFSLGAMLASYVGSQTGLPGVSFASCGLPNYRAPATVANNFINFVEANDPIAEYGTDTLEAGSAGVGNPKMDHYGTVLTLSSPTAEMTAFAQNITGYSLLEYNSGGLPYSQQQIQFVTNEFDDLFHANHQMSLYDPDADALATSFGLDPSAP